MINNVLYYGYDPACRCAGLPEEIIAQARGEPIQDGYGQLVSRARARFRRAVDAELTTVGSNRTHLVPLSGGLDSRAILGSLLAHRSVDPAQIHTVTFGTPGTWDYDIGREVAKSAGVTNTAVDVRPDSFDWSVAALSEFARRQSFPIRMLEGYINSYVSSVVDSDTVLWSGFLGGTTTGQHVSQRERDGWAAAISSFVESNAYTSDLTSPGYEPRTPLPDEPYLPQSSLPYTNQLSFAHRQQCYIRPVVVGDGPCCCPFTRPVWLRFMLNVPREHRAHRKLFVDAMQSAFPELFSIRTDANAGFPLSIGKTRRKLRRGRLKLTEKVASKVGVGYVHPDTNYIDFARWFREGQLQGTAETLLRRFQQRDVAEWLQPDSIWASHQAGADRSRDIKVLCSLELYLSGCEKRQSSTNSS